MKTVSSRTLLDREPWMTLEEHRVLFPDGRTIDDWLWIKTPDYVNVVAVTCSGEFLCFRQTKYAVRGEVLGIVGGYLEQGENPESAARRELREETGWGSNEWRFLGDFAVDGNRGCGRGHLFLATHCRFEGKIESDDLEEMHLVRLGRDEVRTALLEGKFGVMPWTAAVALALIHSQ